MVRLIRRVELLVGAVVLVVAAFSTGLPYLFYIVYLGVLVAGGSYVLTRLGLSDLEAGYAVSRLSGHVGDELRVTYTVRNVGRLPKPWLEVYNPTDLPTGLPARAISLGGGRERSWLVRLPLGRRGVYGIDPLRIRTADPFGLFEAAADVGDGVEVTVYPKVDPLPLWRLPASNLEGTHAAPERTIQSTPLATTVRPWAPGDSFNRIHWRSTARHGEIQVKEFELERTADVWIVLDLEDGVQGGDDETDDATVEVGIRIAASVAHRALEENRSLGMSVNASHQSILPADRGGRQRLKVMQLLAALEGDGSSPLAETLVATLPRLRQGMTVVVVTPSLERSWVRPLALLRGQGVATAVVLLDAASFDEAAFGSATDERDGHAGTTAPLAVAGAAAPAASAAVTSAAPAGRDDAARGRADEPGADPAAALRALRHALAEQGIPVHLVRAGVPLATALTSTGAGPTRGARGGSGGRRGERPLSGVS